MIQNPQTRRQVRNLLIVLNIAIGCILLSLLFFGIVVVRTKQMNIATKQNQYMRFNLQHLPEETDHLQPDHLRTQQEIELQNNRAANNPLNNSSQIITTTEQATSIVKHNLPLEDNSKRTKIAIIITNLGLNKYLTEMALNMPQQVSLGFSPYTSKLQYLLSNAQTKGHEIYLHVPLETPGSKDERGKYTLISRLTHQENIARLKQIVSSQLGYKGLYGSNKEIFTNTKEAMRFLSYQLQSLKLPMIISNPYAPHPSQELGLGKNLIFANIVIDEEVDTTAIQRNLVKLIEYAKIHKVALGYAQNYALTIKILKEWLPSLESEGIELVPVSQLYEKG